MSLGRALLAALAAVAGLPSLALAQGYTQSTFSGTYTPLAGGGTTVYDGSVSSYDNASTQVSIGFSFTFYGNTYSSCWVSTNGLVTFASAGSTTASNAAIASTAAPNRFVALFWDDLVVRNQGTADRISYAVSGTAGSRVMTIQFQSLSVVADGSNTADLTGQVKLYEGTNVVELIYGSGTWTSVTATIGIEDSGGNIGVGGPGTGASNSTLPSVAYRFTPITATVSGTLRYENRIYTTSGFTGSTDQKLARYVDVQLLDRVTGATLGTATTSSAGTFSIGSASCPAAIRLVFTADTSAVTVTNTSGGSAYTSQFDASATSATVALGSIVQTISSTPSMAAALNILDRMVDGWDYATSRMESSDTLPKIEAVWTSGGTNGTYYNGTSIVLLGATSDPDQYDDDVILHEYGHHVMNSLSTDNSPGGSHSWASPSSLDLAWSEGWATYFECAVQNQSTYTDNRPSAATTYNCETPTGSPTPTGSDVEAVVCAILWDIRDAANEAWDYNNGPSASPTGEDRTFKILDVDFDGSSSTDIEEFLSAWAANWPAEPISGLYIRHGVYTDTVDEPNDARTVSGTPSPATFMSSVSRSGEKATPYNEDCFRIAVAESGVTLVVSLAFTHSQGDMDLAVYDAAGNLLDTSEGVGNGESVTVGPVSAGNYYGVAYAYDGDTNPSYTVSYRIPITVTSAASAEWTQGRPFSRAFTKTGGVGTVTWTVLSGTVPPGLALSSAGTLSGTPNTAGVYAFTVRAADAPGVDVTTQDFTFTVNAAPQITTASLSDWTNGHAGYSGTVARTGGTAPFAWRVSAGALPPGLSLAATGLSCPVTGTPTASGSSTFTVELTDAASVVATRQFTVVVNAPVDMAAVSLPEWTQGVAFQQSLAASGGTGALTFSLASGSLAPGVGVSPSGAVSGSPGAAGTFQAVLRATDAVGASADRAVAWIVNLSPGFIGTFGGWTLGRPYSRSLTATNGTLPVTWQIETAALPQGLSFSSSGRVATLSGTPTATGTSVIGVALTDAVGASVEAPLPMTVNPAPQIATTSLPVWTAGHAGYSGAIARTGGTAPFAWQVLSGAVPAGLSLSAAGDTGSLAGTPSAAGTSPVTIGLTDAAGAAASQAFTVVVNDALALTTEALPEWTQDVAFSTPLGATGGTGARTFSVVSGDLPAGVTLSGAGALQGTPRAAGTFALGLRVTDGVGARSDREIAWTVNPRVDIETATVPAWTLGQPYDAAIRATGGTAPIVWEVTGALPPGVVFDAENLRVSGTPEAAGTFAFALTRTDVRGSADSAAYALTVHELPQIVLPDALLFASMQEATRPLVTQFGTAPIAWSLAEGALPAGIQLSADGALGGWPPTSGTYPVTFRITDATGALAELADFVHVADRLTSGVEEPLALAASDAFAHRYFDAIAGTALSLDVKLAPAGALPSLHVFDGAGREVDLAGTLKSSRRKTSVRRFVVPESGRWFARLDNREAAYAADATVKLVLTPRSKWAAHGTADADGAEIRVPFSALAGAKASVAISVAEGAIVLHWTALLGPGGAPVDLGTSLKQSLGQRLQVSGAVLPAGGDYVAVARVVSGAPGEYAAKVKVASPKLYGFTAED